MPKKYNLALVPTSKSQEIIQLAQAFSDSFHQYLLNERSLPHLTLYQFEAEEKDIHYLWERICREWNEKPLSLEFRNFNSTSYEPPISWVSLTPNKSELLQKMHTLIAKLIRLPAKKSFDPQLTLMNTVNMNYEYEMERLADNFTPLRDTFVLALGKSDGIGQFRESIYQL